MTLKDIHKYFKIQLPIGADGDFWNGKPGEFSNIPGMNFSQKYGYTPYSKNGFYGLYKGKYRPHNGHDYAGFRGTPLVFPCDAWLSYVGNDPDGYGNFAFFETESMKRNGVTVKVEYVLAHMIFVYATLYKWYKKGDLLGYMGRTGMSTGPHTHFGVRPLIQEKSGSWSYMFKDKKSMAYRGYIDPMPMLETKPIYDKQKLINAKNMLEKNEKKIIIEGEGVGRKFVVVNNELREIKKDRTDEAALYVLANNGMGETTSTDVINNMPKGKDF